jgi:hypothetical protein
LQRKPESPARERAVSKNGVEVEAVAKTPAGRRRGTLKGEMARSSGRRRERPFLECTPVGVAVRSTGGETTLFLLKIKIAAATVFVEVQAAFT